MQSLLTNILDARALYICPYDVSHKINGSTWHTHLIKCQKANPEVAKDFMRCPFTAFHIVRKLEMGEHLKVCKGRAVMETEAKRAEKNLAGCCAVPLYTRPKVTTSVEHDAEDWDDDFKQQDRKLIENASKKLKANTPPKSNDDDDAASTSSEKKSASSGKNSNNSNNNESDEEDQFKDAND